MTGAVAARTGVTARRTRHCNASPHVHGGDGGAEEAYERARRERRRAEGRDPRGDRAMDEPRVQQGAWIEDGVTRWCVWAPDHAAVEVVLYGAGGQSERVALPMERAPDGFHVVASREAGAGTLYRYRVD